MNIKPLLTISVVAFGLTACVEGQGPTTDLSNAGHLGDSATAPTDPALADPAQTANAPASVIAEARGGRARAGGKLLGQSRAATPGATTLSGAPRPSGPPISLNLQNAVVADAAALILGDALSLPYVVDPGLTGTISLRADNQAPTQLLESFRAALNSRGLALSETGSIYRVSTASAAGPGGATLFPLKNIPADEIAKALELALPADQIRTVSAGGDAVLVTGTPDEIDLARATIEALDVDALAGNSVMLVGLENAPAGDLAAELAGVFGGDAAPGVREGAETIRAGGLRIVPLERLGAVMLLARDGATLDRAFAWVRRLDRPRSAESQRLFVYRVQNRPASTLAESLNALFAGTPASEEGDVAVNPITLRGEPAPRIVVDEEKNALVISAASRQFDTLIDLIRQLDAAPMQVLVETTILEVTLGDNLRYGVQYAFSTGNLFGTSRSGGVVLDSNGTGGITAELPGFAFTIGTNLGAEAIIEALDDISDVTVISSPKLLVRDNQSATLQIGDQVPIVTRTAQGTNVDAQIVNAVEYRDTGVSLTVTPRINSGGYVSLLVDQEISTVTPTVSSGIDSPTISRRSVSTDVTIRDGQTVVLGGLIQDSSSGSRRGIPILSDVPILGAAFGRRAEAAGRTELLALIRPYILSAPEQAEDLTERLRGQFDAITALSKERPKLRQPGRTVLPDLSRASQ